MSRDEFIDGYIARSGIAGEVERTPTGYRCTGSYPCERVALPCDCGDSICDGDVA